MNERLAAALRKVLASVGGVRRALRPPDSQSLRIALLTPEYVTEKTFCGGLATYLRRVGIGLQAHGHRPEVFTISDTQGTIVADGLPVHRVRRTERGLGAMMLSHSDAETGEASQIVDESLSLCEALVARRQDADFDVVQAPNYRSGGLFTSLLSGVPVVTRASTYEPLWRRHYQKPLDESQALIEKLEIFQMKNSAGVYAPSQIIADVLREREGLPLELIEPPFEPWSPPPGGASRVLPPEYGPNSYALFFGSVGLLKGCDRIASVLPSLLDRMRDFRFVFVGPDRGDGPGRTFADKILDEVDAFRDRVVVLSEQPRDVMLDIVAGARFVVLPSRIDNLPNACLEAMSLGKAVIATRDASFDQLIEHGVSGFLVAQDDDSALSSRFEELWRCPDGRLREIGLRAKEALRRLEPNRTIPHLVEFYRRCIASQASGLDV